MHDLTPTSTCPNCGTLAAEGKPHCKNPACRWNTCFRCCHHYDRYTGHHFHMDTRRHGGN